MAEFGSGQSCGVRVRWDQTAGDRIGGVAEETAHLGLHGGEIRVGEDVPHAEVSSGRITEDGHRAKDSRA